MDIPEERIVSVKQFLEVELDDGSTVLYELIEQEDGSHTDEELASYWESQGRHWEETDMGSDNQGAIMAGVYEQCAAELRARRPIPRPKYPSHEEMVALLKSK